MVPALDGLGTSPELGVTVVPAHDGGFVLCYASDRDDVNGDDIHRYRYQR